MYLYIYIYKYMHIYIYVCMYTDPVASAVGQPKRRKYAKLHGSPRNFLARLQNETTTAKPVATTIIARRPHAPSCTTVYASLPSNGMCDRFPGAKSKATNPQQYDDRRMLWQTSEPHERIRTAHERFRSLPNTREPYQIQY